MSERESSGITVRPGSWFARSAVLRWILASATLAALVFALPGSSRAQSEQSPASKSAPAGATSPAKVAAVDTSTVTQTATAKPAAEPAAPAGQSAAKGQQEGIKVHGHWVIEVSNPDGKVVSHTEFENSLTSGTDGGAALLVGVLGRVVTPGSWRVTLADPFQLNFVIINEPNTLASASCPGFVSNVKLTGSVASCSNNLSLSGPQLGSGGISSGALSGGTLTFTGSGQVPQGFPATIGAVQTDSFVCATSDSPTVCSTDSANLQAGLTSKILDGNTVPGDLMPVPVTAGQTVGVTVTISFQ